MHIRFRGFALALAITALAACQSDDPLGNNGPSWLRATLQGAVDANYQGTGHFHTGTNPSAGGSVTFTVYSEGTGDALHQWMMLYRQGGARPAEGVYPLELVDQADGAARGFAAMYRRVAGDTAETFAARSGEVTITTSTPDLIEGTFRFTGQRYNARTVRGTPGGSSVGTASDPDPDAPTVEVSGSFRAVPATDQLILE